MKKKQMTKAEIERELDIKEGSFSSLWDEYDKLNADRKKWPKYQFWIVKKQTYGMIKQTMDEILNLENKLLCEDCCLPCRRV